MGADFGSAGRESAVAAALCRRTSKAGASLDCYFSNSLSKSRNEQLQGVRKSSTQSSGVGVR